MALILALPLAVALPAMVVAHAALDVATPADGASIVGAPTEVAGTFTQNLEHDGSSLQLRDATGQVVATGRVDPADDRRMVVTDLPDLPPGEYEVRWTTLSAEDGELDRDTWTFTVVAAPTTSPTPTSAPTDVPSPAASSPAVSSPSPTAAVTASATAAPSPTAGGGSTGGGGGDAFLPIIAGLALVLIAGVVLLGRRGRSGPPA